MTAGKIDMEIWKEVKGNHNYAVSTLGRVRRLAKAQGAKPGRILKSGWKGDGYLRVALCGGGKQASRCVHRLVATAFLWPRPGLEVNHLDGDKTNNRLDNLELVTKSENQRHAYRTGLRAPSAAAVQAGEQHHNAKLCGDSVREIRVLGASGLSQREIGERMGVDRSNISRVLSGESWKHVA